MSDKRQLIVDELSKLGIDARNNRKVFLKSEEAFVVCGSLSSLNLALPFEALLGGFKVDELVNKALLNDPAEDAVSLPSIFSDNEEPFAGVESRVGFDVVNIEYTSIPKAVDLSNHPSLKAMFSPKELLVASAAPDSHATLCGYLACKEAVYKSGITNKPISEIFLEFDANSIPHFGGREIAVSHDPKGATVYAIYPAYKLRLPGESAGVESAVNIFIHSDSTAQRRGTQNASFEITFPQKISYFLRDYSGSRISATVMDRSTGGGVMYEGIRRATVDLGYISSNADKVSNLIIIVLGEVDAGRLALKPLSAKSYILFFREIYQLALMYFRVPRFLKLLKAKGVQLMVIPISIKSTSNVDVRWKKIISTIQHRLFGKFVNLPVDQLEAGRLRTHDLFDDSGHLSELGHDLLGKHIAASWLSEKYESN